MNKKARTPILEILSGVLYTSRELADYLKLARETLDVWKCTGRYPVLRARKIGGRVMYLGADILKFLDGPHEPAKPYVPKNPRPRPVVMRSRRSHKGQTRWGSR